MTNSTRPWLTSEARTASGLSRQFAAASRASSSSAGCPLLLSTRVSVTRPLLSKVRERTTEPSNPWKYTPTGNLGSLFSSHLAFAVESGETTSSATTVPQMAERNADFHAYVCIRKVFGYSPRNASLFDVFPPALEPRKRYQDSDGKKNRVVVCRPGCAKRGDGARSGSASSCGWRVISAGG